MPAGTAAGAGRLAVALEESGGDPDEIRRVRLSGIALDPTDAQGFMSAARAMADRGEHDRALAFCKQAALLEPTDYHPYETALVYAENAKDVKGMEWAVSNLVSQDWPVDNLAIQANAQKCGIPPTVGEQMRSGHKNTEKMMTQVCNAAQQVQQRGPVAPTLADVLGSSSAMPEATAAKRGGSTFDTLNGNVLTR